MEKFFLTVFCLFGFWTIVSCIPINDVLNSDQILYDDTLPAEEFLKFNKNVPNRGRITGGDEAIRNSLPYQIALSLRKTNGMSTLCGGSLIANNLILTAGHCLYNTRLGFASFGAHNLREENLRIIIEPKDFIIHPEFNSTTLNYDIGLIKLSKSVEINDKIQIIKLPNNSNKNIDDTGKKAIASGWGKDSDNSKFTSNILRLVDLIILDQNECLTFYDEIVIRKQNLCTNGNEGKSTCSGDSGGPLVITNDKNEKIQIGISSFGSKLGCEKGYPAVFTKITSFLDWIHENSF